MNRKNSGSLIDYYAARVAEYERIYAKPERQADLAELRTVVAAFFKDSHVLEIACEPAIGQRLSPRRRHPLLQLI